MTSHSGTYGIVILAAGESSRLGQAKQLLQYQKQSLIRRIAEEAIKAAGERVVVVLGANRESIESELTGTGVITVFNPEWKSGMGSSVRKGLSELLTLFPSIENCIISVCDQPFVTADLFRKLLKMKETSGKSIISSSYQDTSGVPVLFSKKHFPDLLALPGQQGAKKLLDASSDDLASVTFPEGQIDIDTSEDYNNLLGLS